MEAEEHHKKCARRQLLNEDDQTPNYVSDANDDVIDRNDEFTRACQLLSFEDWDALLSDSVHSNNDSLPSVVTTPPHIPEQKLPSHGSYSVLSVPLFLKRSLKGKKAKSKVTTEAVLNYSEFERNLNANRIWQSSQDDETASCKLTNADDEQNNVTHQIMDIEDTSSDELTDARRLLNFDVCDESLTEPAPNSSDSWLSEPDTRPRTRKRKLLPCFTYKVKSSTPTFVETPKKRKKAKTKKSLPEKKTAKTNTTIPKSEVIAYRNILQCLQRAHNLKTENWEEPWQPYQDESSDISNISSILPDDDENEQSTTSPSFGYEDAVQDSGSISHVFPSIDGGRFESTPVPRTSESQVISDFYEDGWNLMTSHVNGDVPMVSSEEIEARRKLVFEECVSDGGSNTEMSIEDQYGIVQCETATSKKKVGARRKLFFEERVNDCVSNTEMSIEDQYGFVQYETAASGENVDAREQSLFFEQCVSDCRSNTEMSQDDPYGFVKSETATPDVNVDARRQLFFEESVNDSDSIMEISQEDRYGLVQYYKATPDEKVHARRRLFFGRGMCSAAADTYRESQSILSDAESDAPVAGYAVDDACRRSLFQTKEMEELSAMEDLIDTFDEWYPHQTTPTLLPNHPDDKVPSKEAIQKIGIMEHESVIEHLQHRNNLAAYQEEQRNLYEEQCQEYLNEMSKVAVNPRDRQMSLQNLQDQLNQTRKWEYLSEHQQREMLMTFFPSTGATPYIIPQPPQQPVENPIEKNPLQTLLKQLQQSPSPAHPKWTDYPIAREMVIGSSSSAPNLISSTQTFLEHPSSSITVPSLFSGIGDTMKNLLPLQQSVLPHPSIPPQSVPVSLSGHHKMDPVVINHQPMNFPPGHPPHSNTRDNHTLTHMSIPPHLMPVPHHNPVPLLTSVPQHSISHTQTVPSHPLYGSHMHLRMMHPQTYQGPLQDNSTSIPPRPMSFPPSQTAQKLEGPQLELSVDPSSIDLSHDFWFPKPPQWPPHPSWNVDNKEDRPTLPTTTGSSDILQTSSRQSHKTELDLLKEKQKLIEQKMQLEEQERLIQEKRQEEENEKNREEKLNHEKQVQTEKEDAQRKTEEVQRKMLEDIQKKQEEEAREKKAEELKRKKDEEIQKRQEEKRKVEEKKKKELERKKKEEAAERKKEEERKLQLEEERKRCQEMHKSKKDDVEQKNDESGLKKLGRKERRRRTEQDKSVVLDQEQCLVYEESYRMLQEGDKMQLEIQGKPLDKESMEGKGWQEIEHFTEENIRLVQQEQWVIEEELRKRNEQQRKKKDPVSDVSSAWSPIHTAAPTTTLMDIQRFQYEKEKQERLIKLEQQNLHNLTEELSNNKNQQGHLKWAQKARQIEAPVKSLSEIQAEEEQHFWKEREQEMAQKEQRKVQQSHMSFAMAQVWGSAAHNLSWIKNDPVPLEEYPLTFQNQQPSTTPKVIQATTGKLGSGFWDDPDGNINTAGTVRSAKSESGKVSKKSRAKNEESVKKLFEQVVVADEFTQWCSKSLTLMQASVDIPTFVTFLKDVESPFEVTDYIRSYLGETKEVKEFAKQFVERRSRWRQALRDSSRDDLCIPAPAVNPQRNDFMEIKSKGKKTKKKMQKLDKECLGFTVAPSEERINWGERDISDRS